MSVGILALATSMHGYSDGKFSMGLSLGMDRSSENTVSYENGNNIEPIRITEHIYYIEQPSTNEIVNTSDEYTNLLMAVTGSFKVSDKLTCSAEAVGISNRYVSSNMETPATENNSLSGVSTGCEYKALPSDIRMNTSVVLLEKDFIGQNQYFKSFTLGASWVKQFDPIVTILSGSIDVQLPYTVGEYKVSSSNSISVSSDMYFSVNELITLQSGLGIVRYEARREASGSATPGFDTALQLGVQIRSSAKTTMNLGYTTSSDGSDRLNVGITKKF